MRIVQKETSVRLRSVYAWLPLQEFEKGHFNDTNICPFAFEVHPTHTPRKKAEIKFLLFYEMV